MSAFDAAWLAEVERRLRVRTTAGASTPPAVDNSPAPGRTPDLFPDEPRPKRRKRALERPILFAVLRALELDPRVGFVFRMNTGAARFDERLVRFAFPGCSDLLGMLSKRYGGRLLAVEVKREGEHPTPEQAGFLAAVLRNDGVAFVARSSDDAIRKLDDALASH